MKKFYSHLVEIESVYIELEKLDLSFKQKSHLANLIDENIHALVLDLVLSELTESDKLEFLRLMRQHDQIKIWELLNKKIEKGEEKIKKVIEELKKELHKDIKEAQGTRKKVKGRHD